MKPLTRTFLMLIVSCELLACTRQIPVSQVIPENNKTYQVDFLFEHDGCKVYRFRDQGNTVYFTNCNGDVTGFNGDSTTIRTINRATNDHKK
jgi:hypothetical protein